MSLRVKFATGFYQWMVPLLLGDVKPAGVDLDIEVINNPREIFERMHKNQEFDVSEMSISEYTAQVSRGSSPFIALPVFPIRAFPHGFLVVNRKSGISTPKDLEGKRVGVPYYHMTSAVYARGMLENDHGVDTRKIHWVEGGMDKPGRHGNPEKWPDSPGLDLKVNDSEYSLDQLLERGELDATLGALMPPSWWTNPDIERLFTDNTAAEIDYYRRTGILPANHIIIMRRALLEQEPSLAASLVEAFTASKDLAVKRLKGHIFGHWPIPLSEPLFRTIDEVLGGDPWPFGIERNRKMLEAVTTFMSQQHMIERPVSPDELFAPGMS
jgi:4,5-dihydroxyphthalate decarboxylase